MKLSQIIFETESGKPEIIHINQEDEWEIAQQVENAFQAAKIRIARNKEITMAALLDGKVIGGTASTWYQTKENDQPIWIYDFDIAVDPKHQTVGLKSRSVGIKLLEAALNEYEQSQLEPKMTYCWVINKGLAKLLEEKYGFTPDDVYGSGGVRMSKH